MPQRGRRARARGRRASDPAAPPEPDADPVELARTIVLRQLAMQARTRQELAEALRRRNVPAEAAEEVLDRMAEVGLIDDGEFARSWVDSRQQRRQLSRTVLRRELQRKGVDRELVDEAVDRVSSEDEHSAAQALAEKKLRSVRGLDRTVQRRRIAGALARRGFSSEIVQSVLRDLPLGEEDLDAGEARP
ncbi:MAG: regulatory protein RecX [Propionibacteriaceae bacterium]|nr:regulatory protein RecX [Propionibacteriaceae bacterium]